MESMFTIAAMWLGLAVLSSIIAQHLKISIALVEICVGVLVANIVGYFWGKDAFGSSLEWLRFLASTGAVLLTILAGVELDPKVIRSKWKEVTVVGVAGFLAPFLGCAAFARFLLGWDVRASWLAGIALFTISMAVVYAVMRETGFNKTEFGKGILAACFINDLGTVLALGLLFAQFTSKTVIFVLVSFITLVFFPAVTSFLTKRYGYKTAAIRAKWVVFVLFGLGALALWAGSEAVLPAYLAGMVLAEFAKKEEHWVRRLRTLTVGFLTPFYFIRAGSLVSLPALVSAPHKEKWYYTLLMSTGLTFGTISALFGYSHGIIDQKQYSFLVTSVIASAVIPMLLANFFFFPTHLIKKQPPKVLAEGIDEE